MCPKHQCHTRGIRSRLEKVKRTSRGAYRSHSICLSHPWMLLVSTHLLPLCFYNRSYKWMKLHRKKSPNQSVVFWKALVISIPKYCVFSKNLLDESRLIAIMWARCKLVVINGILSRRWMLSKLCLNFNEFGCI